MRYPTITGKRFSKKLLTLLVVILVSSTSLFFAFNVEAGAITGLIEIPGTVDCTITFNTSTSSDQICIYYSTTSPVTTGDKHTYNDPLECSYGNRGYRRMIIFGLNESTTYYYRLRDVGLGSWMTTEDSFTTDRRFTDQWIDEFYDEYLIEAKNNIEIVQQTGYKYNNGNTPFISVGTLQNDRLRYVSLIKISDSEYHVYITFCVGEGSSNRRTLLFNSSTVEGFGGMTANDGFNVTIGGSLSYNAIGVPVPDGNKWSIIFAPFSEINVYRATSDNIQGAYTLSPSNAVMNQSDIGSAIFTNILISGAWVDEWSSARWRGYGQKWCPGTYDGRTAFRYPQIFVGYTNSSWMYLSYPLPVNNSPAGYIYFSNVTQYNATAPECQPYLWSTTQQAGCYLTFYDPYDSIPGAYGFGCPIGYPCHNDKLNGAHIYVSRNGWDDWTCVNKTVPAIPNGGGAGNRTFDWGQIDGAWGTNQIVRSGNYDYIIYGGNNGTHNDGWLGQPPAWNQPSRDWTVGLIRFRAGGITAMEPTSSTAWIRTKTIPNTFVNNFTVNGNFTPSSTLKIAVINASTGLPFPGFEFSDSSAIITNNTTITPHWTYGGYLPPGYPPKNLSDIQNVSFQLNFSFTGANGQLFSYSIDNGTGGGGAPIPPSADNISILSINGQGNQSTISDQRPTVNWTKITSAQKYWLQIANDSAFTDLVLNLDNISSTNPYYTLYYSENATRVSFEIPPAFSLPSTSPKIYYVRVKAYALITR